MIAKFLNQFQIGTTIVSFKLQVFREQWNAANSFP